MKQQESTLLNLKACKEGLKGFDFICRTYEEKLKHLCQKLKEKCNGKSLSEEEIALEEYIMSGIDRSKVASMIYSIYRNNGKGIGFSEGKPNEISLKAYCECIKEGLKTVFVPEGAKNETVAQSEPKASSSKAKITSKPKNFKPTTMINYDSKTSKIKILKRSEPVPQSLMKPEAGILKLKSQRKKAVVFTENSEPKGIKPKAMSNRKQSNSQHKVQEVKSKTSNTNSKGPIRQWVPKSENVNIADMSKSKSKKKNHGT
ncbi:hypothetical protein MtrunA17_Chr2g0311791 [Medicago truncatula]|uniref:Uncharacterized protein n=1 Tax=Medicago truncatula TaxID=3880 RepID=A0A396JHK4_MEDTR|nr:hypothetical protein MtrunA17_Chr2g0311791 [Medicago truncatula]